jgi:Na+/proline symporter
VKATSAPRRRIDPIGPVVIAVAIGVLVAALHHPRSGMYIAAAGLAVGALLRVVLSPRNAGSLVVRRKRIDVVVLAGLALALFVLAAVTPFPSHTA